MNVFKLSFHLMPPMLAMDGVVFLFTFLEKTKQKIVVALESLCFQGRSPQQGTLCVIDGGGCFA